MNTQQLVSAIMVKNAITVKSSDKLVEVKHIFEKQQFHHHVPVVENEKLLGIISLTDYMKAVGNASLNDSDEVYQRTLAKDIMTEHVITVNSNDSLKTAIQKMIENMIHALPVIENGKFSGIITSTDVLKLALKE